MSESKTNIEKTTGIKADAVSDKSVESKRVDEVDTLKRTTASKAEEAKNADDDQILQDQERESVDEPREQGNVTEASAAPEKVEQPPKPVEGEKSKSILNGYVDKLNAGSGEVEDAGSAQEQQGKTSEPDEDLDDDIELELSPHFSDSLLNDLVSTLVIQEHQADDQGQLLGDQDLYREMKDSESLANDTTKTSIEKIDLAKDLLNRFYTQFNEADHTTKGIFTDYAIMIGKLLILMKAFVRSAREDDASFPNWGEWATINLPFVGERRRQDFMALAKRRDSYAFSYLGTERLLHLISATDSLTGDDRIGTFLTKYNIGFDMEEEGTKIQDFKCAVDAALAVDRAEKIGVSLDLDKVKSLIQIGGEVDRKTISDLKMISENGGDPEKYLDALIQNRGNPIDFFEGEKLVSQIINLANRLVKGFEKLETDPETMKKLQMSKIQPLEQRIAKLKQAVLGSTSNAIH